MHGPVVVFTILFVGFVGFVGLSRSLGPGHAIVGRREIGLDFGMVRGLGALEGTGVGLCRGSAFGLEIVGVFAVGT